MKKLILLAFAAVSALLALPAFASANPSLHLNATSSFSVSGGASKLERTSGTGTHATSISGTGSFENTTTGTVELTFHGMTFASGGTCESSGQIAGTVKTTKLPFHLVTLNGAQRGILITALNNHFASFNCSVSPLVIPVNVTGNGILGTITSPACGASSTTAKLSFKPSIAGHQQHSSITGVSYGLTSTILGSASPTSFDVEMTITFPTSRQLICT